VMTSPKRPMAVIAVFCGVVAGTLAQTAPRPEFEVASIRPAAPITNLQGKTRIGMRVDAGRMEYSFGSLRDLIRTAWRLKDYQVQAPGWLADARFDIAAKLPDGASIDQTPEMLQALLAERFKLEVHHETREHPVYALVVAKNGPKLTASAPDADGGSAGAARTAALSAALGKPAAGRGVAIDG